MATDSFNDGLIVHVLPLFDTDIFAMEIKGQINQIFNFARRQSGGTHVSLSSSFNTPAGVIFLLSAANLLQTDCAALTENLLVPTNAAGQGHKGITAGDQTGVTKLWDQALQ
jgi:hypothetical protein